MNSLRCLRARPSSAAPLLVLLLLGACLGACDRTNASGGAADPAREIHDLVTALTPPAATALPVEKSEFFATRKRTLERLRGSSEANGLEALRVLREEHLALPEVRAGLLDVAAHTAPKATVDLLAKLVVTFGEADHVRSEATRLLGECDPVRAIEILEPILRDQYDGRTYPPEDRMLAAWLAANERLSLDPVPLLTLVATDLKRPMEARHLATRELGRFPSDQGRQALQNILVESSGNGYIRRLAMQALRESLPKEEFCSLALTVQQRESDPQFIIYIQHHIDDYCR